MSELEDLKKQIEELKQQKEQPKTNKIWEWIKSQGVIGIAKIIIAIFIAMIALHFLLSFIRIL